MATVGSYEAKTHLPRLLERAARGERITITRRGVPIAVLVPAEPEHGVEAAIERLLKLRENTRLDGVTSRQLVEEGRRY